MQKLLQEIDTLAKKISTRRPVDTATLQAIKEYYRIGLTYTSNALEGNTLTESETKVVLEEGITIGGKRLVEHLEAVGHSQAYDFVYLLIGRTGYTQDDIKRLHHLFYNKIDSERAGVYRDVQVYITGSRYPLPKPQEVHQFMEKFITKSAEYTQLHPVIHAALAHKEFVYIHPFF